MAVVTTFRFESSTQPEWPQAYYALKIMHLINHPGVVASRREKGCLVAGSPQPRTQRARETSTVSSRGMALLVLLRNVFGLVCFACSPPSLVKCKRADDLVVFLRIPSTDLSLPRKEETGHVPLLQTQVRNVDVPPKIRSSPAHILKRNIFGET